MNERQAEDLRDELASIKLGVCCILPAAIFASAVCICGGVIYAARVIDGPVVECDCDVDAPSRRPTVIAVPGDEMPHQIRIGDVSEFDGFVLPTPLFRKLTPCFKDVLEHPGPEPHRGVIDGE